MYEFSLAVEMLIQVSEVSHQRGLLASGDLGRSERKPDAGRRRRWGVLGRERRPDQLIETKSSPILPSAVAEDADALHGAVLGVWLGGE